MFSNDYFQIMESIWMCFLRCEKAEMN